MTDLVLEHLKRIQGDVSEMKRDIRDVKGSISTLLGITGELVKSTAREEERFSNPEVRIERIERRLDLRDEP